MHVHRFRRVIRALADEGHEVLVLSRDKDVTLSLLDVLQIRHRCISRARRGTPGRVIENIIRHVRALMVALTFRPDLIVSAGSASVIYAGWLLRVPRIVHLDSNNLAQHARHFAALADRIVTTESASVDLGERQAQLPSCDTLAYLHPDVFTPDDRVLDRYGLRDVSFAVVRLESEDQEGLPGADMKRLVRTLEQRGIKRIVLSQQGTRARIENAITPAPADFHHLLARAGLCIGGSTNVASEAATLGVPTFLVGHLDAGIRARLDDDGLIRRFDDGKSLLRSLEQLEDFDTLRESARSAQLSLLEDMADMNQCWLELIRDLLPTQASND